MPSRIDEAGHTRVGLTESSKHLKKSKVSYSYTVL